VESFNFVTDLFLLIFDMGLFALLYIMDGENSLNCHSNPEILLMTNGRFHFQNYGATSSLAASDGEVNWKF
jgi:hypothetical protein